MVRLFQFIGRICPSIHPSFLSTTPLNAAWAAGIQLCAFRVCQPGVCTAEALCFHCIIWPRLLFWVSSGPCSLLFLCWRFCGWAEALGQTAPPGNWRWVKESSCSTSGGQKELNLDYCMLLSVVRRVDYEHEQSFDTMNFFNSCFKSCILEREKINQTQGRHGEKWNARRNQSNRVGRGEERSAYPL